MLKYFNSQNSDKSSLIKNLQALMTDTNTVLNECNDYLNYN